MSRKASTMQADADKVAGKLDQLRSDSKRQWNKLTDSDLDKVKGNAQELVSLVQQKYDYTKDQAQHEVTRFMNSHDGKVYQMARRLPGDVDDGVRRHPWAAVATAMGLGLAMGFLVKPGRASAARRY